jgi:hypothetical protein
LERLGDPEEKFFTLGLKDHSWVSKDVREEAGELAGILKFINVSFQQREHLTTIATDSQQHFAQCRLRASSTFRKIQLLFPSRTPHSRRERPGSVRQSTLNQSRLKYSSLLGLAKRQASSLDRRVSQALITQKGKRMTDLVDAARDRIGRTIFANWEPTEIRELLRLMRKFADAIKEPPNPSDR